MAVCVPIRDMKDTGKFSALVEAERDVTVNKNGYTAMHCLNEEAYQEAQEALARAQLYERILLAEREEAQGLYDDFDDFATAVRARYGL